VPVLLVLVLVATGCGDEVPGGAGGAAGDAASDRGTAAPSSPTRITGYLTIDEVPVLALCGTGEERTLDGPAFPDLLDLHGALAPGVEPMEGVFVDVLGSLVDGAGGAAIEALEVRRAAWEGGGCGELEPGLVFRAHGTEPFWSLSVLAETLTWRTPEGERTLAHRGPYRSDRGDWLVDGTVEPTVPGSGVTPVLTARFFPEPCRDAMSGAWFHMSAEVILDGQEYRGCAFSGGESLP
jgi:uncharacterized membrane protein